MPCGQASFSAAEQRLQVGVLAVVDAGVEAELVDHRLALVRPAGQADDAASQALGQLPDHTAHRAAGGTDHHRLAGLGLDDGHQPDPGGDARHADRAQVGRQRHAAGVDLAPHRRLRRVDQRIVLPAARAHDLVADLEGRVLRGQHLADAAALHHRIQRLWLRVALAVVHAPAHVRVQAHEMVAHQHLAVLQLGHRGLDQLEVRWVGLAGGARNQMPLLVDCCHVCLLCERQSRCGVGSINPKLRGIARAGCPRADRTGT